MGYLFGTTITPYNAKENKTWRPIKNKPKVEGINWKKKSISFFKKPTLRYEIKKKQKQTAPRKRPKHTGLNNNKNKK